MRAKCFKFKLQVDVQVTSSSKDIFGGMTNYLFNSIQVTSYYSQITRRGTSYKFEIGHLLEEGRKSSYKFEVTSSNYKLQVCELGHLLEEGRIDLLWLLVVDGSAKELAQVAAKNNI
jgi:hypothetical protein